MSEFFGLQIHPNKSYSTTLSRAVRVTTVTFGKNVKKDSRSVLLMAVGESTFPIAVLNAGQDETKMVDTLLPAGEDLSLFVTGPNTMYLTGHYLEPESDEDMDGLDGLDEDEFSELIHANDDYDSEEDSDFSPEDSDEDELIGNVEELEEDEEEDDDEEEEEKPKPVKKAEEVSKVEEKPLTKKEKKEKNKAENANKRKLETEQPKEIKKGKTEEPKKEVAKEQAHKKEAPKSEQKSNQTKKFPNGLTLEDKKIGEGNEARVGNKVGVRYVGRLTNGKIFDSNTKGKPFFFRLGGGEVIKGWDQGVVGMKKGGERKLIIPAPLAYGKSGAPPDIPPNATLEFEIKLIEIRKK